MKKLFSVFMTTLIILVLAACGSNPASNGSNKDAATEGIEEKNEKITISHKLGETTFQKSPQKVVVFDFGILDTLDKLGVDVAGVPQDTIPDYLSTYADKQYVNVGSIKEIDFEKVSEVQPGLIIITDRQADFYEELSEIAPTIYLGVDNTKYMASFEENMKMLGEIFNKEAEVKNSLAAIKETIATLKTSSADKDALVILLNDGAISAYGPGSRFGIIHDVMGVPAVDEGLEVSTHGQKITFEYIAEKNPDYLFVIDRTAIVGGETSANEALENELIKGTNAYKNGNIVYLDSALWYLSGGGLVSLNEMIKEVEVGLE